MDWNIEYDLEIGFLFKERFYVYCATHPATDLLYSAVGQILIPSAPYNRPQTAPRNESQFPETSHDNYPLYGHPEMSHNFEK